MARAKKNEVAIIEVEAEEPDFQIEYNPHGGKQVNRPHGKRRSPHDPEVVGIICRGIAAGIGMLRILKDDPTLPHPFQVHNAIVAEPNSLLAVSIARAREEAHHAILDKCEELAASITPENVEVVTKKIWWHQWHLARIKPRKYSEKHYVEQTVVDPPKLTAEEFTDIAYRIVEDV